MKKFRKIVENVALGLFVNGSFSISQEGLTTKSLIITSVALYAMIVTIIFEED